MKQIIFSLGVIMLAVACSPKTTHPLTTTPPAVLPPAPTPAPLGIKVFGRNDALIGYVPGTAIATEGLLPQAWADAAAKTIVYAGSSIPWEINQNQLGNNKVGLWAECGCGSVNAYGRHFIAFYCDELSENIQINFPVSWDGSQFLTSTDDGVVAIFSYMNTEVTAAIGQVSSHGDNLKIKILSGNSRIANKLGNEFEVSLKK